MASSKQAARMALMAGLSASRPSLPTTGLFAPTAALLAKVRNASPPPPPPSVPCKVDLSRLSKPTAASAGKVRAVQVSQPLGSSTPRCARPPQI
jgi:hypothetical protein